LSLEDPLIAELVRFGKVPDEFFQLAAASVNPLTVPIADA